MGLAVKDRDKAKYPPGFLNFYTFCLLNLISLGNPGATHLGFDGFVSVEYKWSPVFCFTHSQKKMESLKLWAKQQTNFHKLSKRNERKLNGKNLLNPAYESTKHSS